MGKSVGLEIHARGVRAVEVHGRGKGLRVSRYVETDVASRGGAPDPEELREALESIFKRAKYSRHHVVASVEAHETVVREIPVPFKAEDQIRKVIKFEAEHHLHDCDADDVIVQYTRVSESKDGTNLLVFASRKADISRRIEYTRSVGVEPLALDLDALAYLNTVRAAGLLEETPTCVLLNIAHRSTEMVFVEEGELRALRSVRMGVDSIAHGLARDMDIDVAEADSKLNELVTGAEDDGDLLLPVGGELEEKKETEKSHAELEHDLFEQKREEFVARLKREFVRSTAALRGSRQPTKIVATGPGLRVPALLDHLGQRLGIPIEVFKPRDHFRARLDESTAADFDTGAAVPLGLALKGLGSDSTGVDFRQEELKVANKFELLKNALAVTVTLLFLGLMALSFYFVYMRSTLAEERYEPQVTKAYQSFSQVAQKYNALEEALVPARYKVNPSDVELAGPPAEAIQRFVSKLRVMRRRLQDIVGDTQGLPPITSALKMWNDIFSRIATVHEEIEYIDFESIEIKQDSVVLMIVVPSVAAAERLDEALQKLDVLQDFQLEPYRVTPLPNTDKQRARLAFKKRRSRR
jgi:type IV pilus assembly protein PilM